MSIAGNASRRPICRGTFLGLIMAAAACGCGHRPPATIPTAEPQRPLRPSERSAPGPVGVPLTAATKPAGAGDERAKAQSEFARQSATLKTSQVEAKRRELQVAQANLRGWHHTHNAAQLLVAALQKTAAVLNDRNAELARQKADAASSLSDARANLASQTEAAALPVTPESPVTSGAPGTTVDPPPAPTPRIAPVGPPPLGVVRDVRPFRGRPYATLSIGHDAGVRRGMRFGLADPRTGAPAGVLTIDEVGPEEAGGLVEGADPFALHAGLTVHELADLAH